jgi:hypothetical protein
MGLRAGMGRISEHHRRGHAIIFCRPPPPRFYAFGQGDTMRVSTVNFRNIFERTISRANAHPRARCPAQTAGNLKTEARLEKATQHEKEKYQ